MPPARLLLAACVFLALQHAAGAPSVPITGDRISGFVLPVEPRTSDIRISALRAWSWTVDDTRRLLLAGPVHVNVGAFDVVGDNATVWLNRIHSAGGPINQIAVYFDRVTNPAQRSGLGVRGQDILMTGSARGAVALDVSLLEERRPPPAQRGLVERGELRLAAYLSRIVQQQPPPLATYPQVDKPQAEHVPVPVPGETLPRPAPPEPAPGRVPAPTRTLPLFDPGGTVWLSWQDVQVSSGDEENVVTATGGVVVHYVSGRSGDWSELTLSARRAVIFTDPGPLERISQMDASSIRGIYLEGNVVATADRGTYTLRAPRVYYDLGTDRAIMLDAVLRTYGRDINAPIYARAREMQQIAANQWTAQQATVSTSEFFTPHVSLGAQRVTVTQRPPALAAGDAGSAAEAEPEVYVDSMHNTLKLAGVPVLYWPRFNGTVRDVPLKGIGVGYRDSEGVGIETEWDPFTLFGAEQPPGTDTTLRLDGFTKRGPAAGIEHSYARESYRGAIDLYGLYDQGVDHTSSGRDVTPSTEWRGIALWQHDQQLSESWDFQAQLAAISDPTFVTTWREEDFYNRREYETSAYVSFIPDNSAFTGLVKWDANDFISNSWLLASRQYQVDKIPEFTYRRYGDSLFDRLTYSGETRATRMRLSLESGTPNELGVKGAAFGIPNTTPIAAPLVAAGFNENWIGRFDTRQEVALPVELGPVSMVPFIVGRLTAYTEDFQAVSPAAKATRLFGSAGVRMNTRFQRVYNDVESELLDLHRLRHVIEPRAMVWYGYTDVPDGSYPVYDENVESIGGASVVEFGVNSTLQTQRGGPGRWRSVDVLVVDASVVFNSDDAVRESPTPQFFEYRPEQSQFGDHVFGEAVWKISDTLSISGQGTWDLDNSLLARASVGTQMRHSPVFSTYIEYRYIQADSTELLEIGWQYMVTSKYDVQIIPQWDFTFNDFRAVSLVITRTFPDFKLRLSVSQDQIADETSFGAGIDLVEF